MLGASVTTVLPQSLQRPVAPELPGHCKALARKAAVWLVAALAIAGRQSLGEIPIHPDISGVWQATHYIQELKTREGAAPPLKPAAAATYARNRALYRSGNLSFDPSAHCKAVGMPRLMFLPYPFQIVQRPMVVAFLYEWQRSFRRVDLTENAAEVDYPLPRGVSVGHADGDALVIDTIGLIGDTLLDAAGMPHSEKLRVVERYKLRAHGNVLQNTLRFEDPETFERPWETTITYRLLPRGTELKEDVCIDRIESGRRAIEFR